MRPVTERSTLLVRNLLLPTSTSLFVVIREGGGIIIREMFVSLEVEREENMEITKIIIGVITLTISVAI